MELLEGPAIIMDVHQRLATIMENEAELLGLQVDRPQLRETRRVVFNRIQLAPLQFTSNEEESERLDDRELSALTVHNIESTYKQRWSRLTEHQKLQCIHKFAQQYMPPERHITEDDRFSMEEFLVSVIMDTKKLKPKHIKFDETQGRISEIPRLSAEAACWKLKPEDKADKSNIKTAKPLGRGKKIASMLSKLK